MGIQNWRTTVARTFAYYRYKQIDRYAQGAADIQAKQLQRLLLSAKNTEWGQQHDFASIKGYAEYSKRFPIQTYEDLKPYILRMIEGEADILWKGKTTWFAKSSGTTNDKSKFIPVTRDVLDLCHYKGGWDTALIYVRNHPKSQFFHRKSFILGGSHSPSPINSHASCGDLSAVLVQNISAFVELMRVPCKEIILMDNWEEKLEALMQVLWKEDIVSLSGVPSWMLIVLKNLIERTGKKNLSEVWPHLEVFFHGGISFTPYRKQYESLIPSQQMHYMETYNASEGFFALQDETTAEGMLLMQDYGTFYEFIPMECFGTEDETCVPLEDVEVGKNYAMVVSTVGGLWRYLIGDTVRFVSVRPHRIVITGRTKHFINAFGEELMVDNADKALHQTCLETGASVKEYTAAPLFHLDKAKGCHQWLIEFEQKPASVSDFAQRLDAHLQQLNSDYEAKRYKDFSLQPLQIVEARAQVFYDWLKEKGKLGGQHKVPRLSNDRSYMEQLLLFNQK